MRRQLLNLLKNLKENKLFIFGIFSLMQLHELQRTIPNKKAKRVGRGGKRGKTSGRGHKGQKAHSGRAPRPEIRDMIKKLPKLRGHGINRSQAVHTGRVKVQTVNLDTLSVHFSHGDHITPEILLTKKLIARSGGRMALVKILARGSFDKKVTVSGCLLSKTAKEAIIKAGGEVR